MTASAVGERDQGPRGQIMFPDCSSAWGRPGQGLPLGEGLQTYRPQNARRPLPWMASNISQTLSPRTQPCLPHVNLQQGLPLTLLKPGVYFFILLSVLILPPKPQPGSSACPGLLCFLWGLCSPFWCPQDQNPPSRIQGGIIKRLWYWTSGSAGSYLPDLRLFFVKPPNQVLDNSAC